MVQVDLVEFVFGVQIFFRKGSCSQWFRRASTTSRFENNLRMPGSDRVVYGTTDACYSQRNFLILISISVIFLSTNRMRNVILWVGSCNYGSAVTKVRKFHSVESSSRHEMSQKVNDLPNHFTQFANHFMQKEERIWIMWIKKGCHKRNLFELKRGEIVLGCSSHVDCNLYRYYSGDAAESV